MTLKMIFVSFFFCLMLNSSYALVRVGTVFFYPPYVESPDSGFDIDLIETIFQRMNEPYKLIPMDYQNLFSALNDDQIDIAIGGISISADKLQTYIFSLPYMLSKGQFLVLKEGKIKSVSDLKGATVGIIKEQIEGTGLFYTYLSSHYNNLFQIKFFNDVEDLITALTKQEIAAAFIHHSPAVYWERNGENLFQTLGKVEPIGDGIGIMALPEQQALIQKINQQLQGMEKDNSYINLYNTYFAEE